MSRSRNQEAWKQLCLACKVLSCNEMATLLGEESRPEEEWTKPEIRNLRARFEGNIHPSHPGVLAFLEAKNVPATALQQLQYPDHANDQRRQRPVAATVESEKNGKKRQRSSVEEDAEQQQPKVIPAKDSSTTALQQQLQYPEHVNNQRRPRPSAHQTKKRQRSSAGEVAEQQQSEVNPVKKKVQPQQPSGGEAAADTTTTVWAKEWGILGTIQNFIFGWANHNNKKHRSSSSS